MRAYLAIIKDSFREAMSSRVLWLLLAAITLFLLVVAPLGIKQQLTINYTGLEFRDPPAFVGLLKEAADKPEATPAKHVWSLLDEGGRAELEKARAALDKKDSGGAYVRLIELLAREFNELVKKDDLYSADVWKEVRLNEEAREYLDKGRETLGNDERLRMNRVLLEAAFPNQFLPLPQKSLVGTYLTWESPPIPLQQSSMRAFIEEYVLSNFLSWIVGSVGVLVAIVVTASIIPQMFDPGALHLLLSKPVNRSILFLSKFFGGCAFTFLNVGYLLAGLWLILGLRFGIWNAGLFYCVPVFMFMFAIYYAVSALSSVVWRNAIVSVMITILFWAACFGVGALKVNVVDYYFMKPQRIVKLIPAGDTLLSVNEFGAVMQWNDDERAWRGIFHGQDRGPIATPIYIGPLYDAKHDQLVGANTFRMGSMEIPVQLVVGKRSEGWRRKPSVGMPGGAADMFLEPEQNRKESEKDQPGILVVSTAGLFRFADVPPRKILGVEVAFGSGPQFVPVAAQPDLFFNTPLTAALNDLSGKVVVYSRGTVKLFAANDAGKYELEREKKLDVDEDAGAILSFAGSTLLLACEDGKIQVLDPQTLSVEGEFRGERRSQPRFVSAAPGGQRFAIVYQNGKLWVLDVVDEKLRRASVSGQGDIFAAIFKSSNRLLVADRTTRVSEYAADSYKLQSRLAPSMPTIEKAYRYGMNSLYFVFPRPGEFGYTMQYALTGKESNSSFSGNMQAARDSLDPWRPVWNGLIFMLVMLGIACVYFERQEY